MTSDMTNTNANTNTSTSTNQDTNAEKPGPDLNKIATLPISKRRRFALLHDAGLSTSLISKLMGVSYAQVYVGLATRSKPAPLDAPICIYCGKLLSLEQSKARQAGPICTRRHKNDVQAAAQTLAQVEPKTAAEAPETIIELNGAATKSHKEEKKARREEAKLNAAARLADVSRESWKAYEPTVEDLAKTERFLAQSAVDHRELATV